MKKVILHMLFSCWALGCLFGRCPTVAHAAQQRKMAPLAPKTDSVLLAYANFRWHKSYYNAGSQSWPELPENLTFTGGNKNSQLWTAYPYLWMISKSRRKPLSDIYHQYGSGVLAYSSGVAIHGTEATDFNAQFYRDAQGRRLITFNNYLLTCLGYIVTQESRHAAKKIPLDLGQCYLSKGFGLGMAERNLLAKLGKPWKKDFYRGYRIYLYLQKPRRVTPDGGMPYKKTMLSGFAFKKNLLVEFSQYWHTNERMS